jgi:hypothetical protein
MTGLNWLRIGSNGGLLGTLLWLTIFRQEGENYLVSSTTIGYSNTAVHYGVTFTILIMKTINSTIKTILICGKMLLLWKMAISNVPGHCPESFHILTTCFSEIVFNNIPICAQVSTVTVWPRIPNAWFFHKNLPVFVSLWLIVSHRKLKLKDDFLTRAGDCVLDRRMMMVMMMMYSYHLKFYCNVCEHRQCPWYGGRWYLAQSSKTRWIVF